MTREQLQASELERGRDRMLEPGAEFGTRAAALRSAFDRAFAAAPALAQEASEALLAIHVGGDPYALRLSELAGLLADRKIVAMPSSAPGLLGLTGLRGAVLPVYSLAAWLGYAVPLRPPRWLAVAALAPDQQFGLGFEQFDGYLRVPRAQIGAASEGSRSHAPETLRLGAESRAVLDIASIAAAIAERAAAARPGREG